VAQITSVTSEALQAAIRRLLPSQQGFGEDLQASNVITPIIDLTSTAEGSSVPSMLQTALAFGSNTAFLVDNSTSVIANVGGFYRIYGTATIPSASSVARSVRFSMSDGATSKNVWLLEVEATGSSGIVSESYDFVTFLRPSDTISAISDDTDSVLAGSIRQIADSGGNLVNPVGFTPQ
jgi:hypothetical protein